MTNKDSRWFDEGDFTPEHDKLLIWFARNWKTLLPSLSEDILRLEECLHGYPPVFPDAVIYKKDDSGYLSHNVFVKPLVAIELKVFINNVSEVLRQISIYRQRVKGFVILLTPDTTYDEIFRMNDIVVKHPEKDENGEYKNL